MKQYGFDALVVGSGAAGYAAAVRLADGAAASGMNFRTAIVTSDRLAGTSRNAGSDKQTYYKLSLAGETPDSVGDMAADLFAGGAVDGDNALCEAACSAECFLKLASLGVGFPKNSFGEYVGYRTDHDLRGRASSAGPLTSKEMTEALERRAAELGIPLFDGMTAVRVLTSGGRVSGLLCADRDAGEFVLFDAPKVILATGGPARIYADSVYPVSQTGSTGLAIAAGASLQNMTEWQYGLASTDPRWNVSGTYMQVLPRIFSVGEDGEEKEFLSEYFPDVYAAMSAVFLKGYQWPFDSARTEGSSKIDLAVWREHSVRGRRVYLDYTKNPFGIEDIEFEKLSAEAFGYLSGCGACFGRPVERLAKMNAPAIELYVSKGRDISREPLEISLSAQHCNGGIAVDADWQTSVPGLFAVGEAAGTHGIRRPGGSALNAGQAGAARAAEYILDSFGRDAAAGRTSNPAGGSGTEEQIAECLALAAYAESTACGQPAGADEIRRGMSRVAGAIRIPAGEEKLLRDIEIRLEELVRGVRASTPFPTGMEVSAGERIPGAAQGRLPSQPRLGERSFALFGMLDLLLTSGAVLTAMTDYSRKVGVSRGSALYISGYSGDGLPGEGAAVSDRAAADTVQEIRPVLNEDFPAFVPVWRAVRPVPERKEPFETVWREYREKKIDKKI